MIFEVLAEVVQAILSFFLEMVIRLLALVLRSGYLIEHTRGVGRYAHFAAAVLGGYLVFGIARFGLEGLATPGLQPLYAWPLVIAALVLLLIALAVPEAAREIAAPSRKAARQEEPAILWPLTLGLAFALVIGGISLFSAQSHRRNLADRACDAANARISPALRDTAERGIALADTVLKRAVATSMPCAE